MKIETTNVIKVLISELTNLDPITVILEDFGPGQGKIIIECWGQSWSSYWGSMGDRTIAQFFISCSEDYIIGKLSPLLRDSVVDTDALPEFVRKEISRGRKLMLYTEEEARELWDKAEYISDPVESRDLLCQVLGDEWWRHDLPEKPNHEYVYLCRIIEAVKTALKALEVKEAA